MKLFDICKKRIGINRSVFEKIVCSGDLSEWSVASCLNSAQTHDNKIIVEGDADEEQTQCLSQSHIINPADLDLDSPSPRWNTEQFDGEPRVILDEDAYEVDVDEPVASSSSSVDDEEF